MKINKVEDIQQARNKKLSHSFVNEMLDHNIQISSVRVTWDNDHKCVVTEIRGIYLDDLTEFNITR